MRREWNNSKPNSATTSNAFVADLGNSEAINQLVKDVEAKFGRIDILVNNAGLTRDNLFIRMSDEEWQLVLDVNLRRFQTG